MKRLSLILAAAFAICSHAAVYDFDLTAEAPAPALDGIRVGDEISLRLPSDAVFHLHIVSAPPAGIAGQSFVARDAGAKASAIVKPAKDGWRITIDDFTNRRQYTVRSKGGKTTVAVQENEPDACGECGTCSGAVQAPAEDAPPAAGATRSTRRLTGAAGTGFPLEEHKSIIDIFVVFDQGAKAYALGEEGNWDSLEDCADAAVQRMNDVVANSRNDDLYYFRLVGVTEVNGSYDNIDSTLLHAVSKGYTPFEKLASAGAACGADVVVTLVNVNENRDKYNTGVAWGLEYGITQSHMDDYIQEYGCGYAICHIQRTFREYTMAHEVGHTMGAGHANTNVSFDRPQTVEYSCGYHFISGGKRYRTIMGYNRSSLDNGQNIWDAAPYFSEPSIPTNENGVAVYDVPIGTAISNDNRRVLRETCKGVSNYREHAVPYDWDVRFLDDDGNDIPDGACIYTGCDVTLTHPDPNAVIYYSLDGSTLTADSPHGASGTKVYMYLVNGAKTLSACAVVDGVAQSVRSITLHDGLTWSGDANGNGVWASADSSARPWSGEYFYGDAVTFPDLAGVSSATVMVQDAVAPAAVALTACETAYTFAKGTDAAQIAIPDGPFVPGGNVTFDVPVKFGNVVFTNLASRTISFNAPFGQQIDENCGCFTNKITIFPYGTLSVAPGEGKTQTFNRLDNDWFASTAAMRVGEGTVVFNGPVNGGAGVAGSTGFVVDDGGNLVFDVVDATGYEMQYGQMTVNRGGVVTYKKRDTLRRTLNLNGGTVRLDGPERFDWFNGNTINVTDDASFEDKSGSAYVWIRKKNATVNVDAGKTFAMNVAFRSGTGDTSGGLVKNGEGEMAANKAIAHSTATTVANGTLTLGYSTDTAYGSSWTVQSGAKLKLKNGCAVKLPSLALASGAALSVPAADAAPLTVASGAVDLSGVYIELTGADDLGAGASYPVIQAVGGISNASAAKLKNLPALDAGLKWVAVVDGNSLSVEVAAKSDMEMAFEPVTNIENIKLTMPDDAVLAESGGVAIADSPMVIEGFAKRAFALTLDVDIPDVAGVEHKTLCSWDVGGNIVRCVVTNGIVDCFFANNGHSENSTNFMAIAKGRHTIAVGYNSDGSAGTCVYVDNRLAYFSSALKWGGKDVQKITVGATAATPSTMPYPGLVVHGIAVIDPSSTAPLPNMTVSGGTATFNYLGTKSLPCVFANTVAGGWTMGSAVLPASFSGTYSEMSVSVVAAFPENSTGAILSAAMVYGNASYATQVEYCGGGTFAFREDGNDDFISQVNIGIDVSKPHLYTLTYIQGTGFSLYVDGVVKMYDTGYFQSVSLPAGRRVLFGCGYWNQWLMGSEYNPMPMPDLTVYASHIAFGTSDNAVSESAVMESLNFAAAYDDLTVAEKLSYLPEYQTAYGVAAPPTAVRLPTVDILVAFDNGAANYVAGKGKTLEVFAEEQIQKMNDVLVTNRLDSHYSYRLAGVCRVYATYSDINEAVTLIKDGASPCTILRAAREMYGADTVTLLVKTSGAVLGHSSPLSSSTDVASCHDDAFSVCSIDAVVQQYTMIHENAHNMGCGHSKAQAQNPGGSVFSYGSGYYYQDGGKWYHTIMAYDTDGSRWHNLSPYFSTSSDEFGLVLGDAENDNARVLRETCAYVAQWRECVKPFDDDVVATDAAGNEILNARVFNGSIAVSLSKPGDENAKIVYTLDGSSPTVGSSVYAGPLEFDDDATLTVATLDGAVVSPARTIRLFRRDAVPAEGVWYTCAKYPWTMDGDAIRSCNHTNYSVYCTTPLSVVVEGPKRLWYKYRSYFLTPSVDSNFSHIEVLLDDAEMVSTNIFDTAWNDAYVDIPEGEHRVAFVYSQRKAMNDPLANKSGEVLMDDALWIKDIRFEDLQTYEVPAGVVVALDEIVASGAKYVIGEGTVNCGATLPDDLGWKGERWKGTVAFDGLGDSIRNFDAANYGNANSCVRLKNCAVSELSQNGVFAGRLWLDGDMALRTKDGYSNDKHTFGELAGDGSMKFTGNPTQHYVFNIATNYTGSIDAGKRRIVFGQATTIATDSTITVRLGAVASIGGTAVWVATNGIEIAGTLLVKGAGARLDCDQKGAAMGLKLTGGATLRFDAADAKLTFAKAPQFASGTVKIAFGEGVKPTKGAVLIDWSSSQAEPMGNFTFADSSLADRWELVKNSTGLVVSAIVPADGFEVPGTDEYIVNDDALAGWLDDQNFWMYDTTWQEFLNQKGDNGYENWRNFLLGFGAENDSRTFNAEIEIEGGKVKIKTTAIYPPAGYKIVKRLHYRADLDKAEEQVFDIDDEAAPLDAAARPNGFYWVTVELQ